MEDLKRYKLKLLNSMITRVILKVLYYWKGRSARITPAIQIKKPLSTNLEALPPRPTNNGLAIAHSNHKRFSASFTEKDFLNFSAKIVKKPLHSKRDNITAPSTSLFDQVKATLQLKAQNAPLRKQQNCSDALKLIESINQEEDPESFFEKTRYRRSCTGDQSTIAVISCKKG